MKTTVKLGAGKAIVVSPAPGGVRVDLTVAGVVMGGDRMTPDQCGALIFGIEQALEKGQIEADRTAGRCQADGCGFPARDCGVKAGQACGLSA